MSDRLSPPSSAGQTGAGAGRALDAWREGAPKRPGARRLALACLVVFAVALGVRLLYWQDNRHDFVYQGMAEEYKAHSLTLYRGDWRGFLYGPDPPSDANVVKHPPGWPVLSAAVFHLFGPRDAPLRFVNVLLDALAAVLVVLIAAELFPFGAAVVAGLLVALSPQLAYHAVTLVPDPTAVSPLLVGVYFFVRAVKRPRLRSFVAAGAMLGVSCWLRSNALLLPFFLAALVPFLFARGRRVRYAAALVGAFLAVVAPVTIRNYVAFRSFIPLSLSAGITLVEGIGVYDEEGRFGLPDSDVGVTKWEAELYGRPDYYGTRFAPDGVERERRRVAHGLKVVRENPVWFARVMLHRAASMLRLARVELVAPYPSTTRPLDLAGDAQPAHALAPEQIQADARTERDASLSPSAEGGRLRFEGGGAGMLFRSPPMSVRAQTDYLLRAPLKIERGSVVLSVVDARRDGELAATPVLHPVNYADFTTETQPPVVVRRPFTSGGAEEVRLVFSNGDRRGGHVAAELGRVELFALGPASHTWTRLPRLLVRAVQRVFLTAVMLPLYVLGAALLVVARRFGALALMLVVPAYYMAAQSALWTEFRYILAMHYFLPVLAALALYWLALKLRNAARRPKTTKSLRASSAR